MRSSERKLGALAAATGLSAVARETVHRAERAATSDTGERLVLRRRRQLREVVPLPCRSMQRACPVLVEEERSLRGVKVADQICPGIFFQYSRNKRKKQS
jgi:hypothetical protein